MPPVSKRFLPKETKYKIYSLLISAIGKVNKRHDISPFLSDLLTPTEKIMIAKRLAIAFLLLRGDIDQRQISHYLKVSTSTVARVNLILNTQGKGYRNVIAKIMNQEALRKVLNELYEGLTPLPGKGKNWGEWKKKRKERRKKLDTL